MKALTIWQPWASLIACGAKPYEFRGWPAPRYVRGTRIAIHAGARPIRKDEVADLIFRLSLPEKRWSTGLVADVALMLLERALRSPDALPRSSVVATAVIGEPVTADTIMHMFGAPTNDSMRSEHANFAWPLTAIEPLLPPFEVRGAQGFWNVVLP